MKTKPFFIMFFFMTILSTSCVHADGLLEIWSDKLLLVAPAETAIQYQISASWWNEIEDAELSFHIDGPAGFEDGSKDKTLNLGTLKENTANKLNIKTTDSVLGDQAKVNVSATLTYKETHKIMDTVDRELTKQTEHITFDVIWSDAPQCNQKLSACQNEKDALQNRLNLCNNRVSELMNKKCECAECVCDNIRTSEPLTGSAVGTTDSGEHTWKDISIGLAIIGGLLLILLIKKPKEVVRYRDPPSNPPQYHSFS